jgi:DNA replication protein DnaC
MGNVLQFPQISAIQFDLIDARLDALKQAMAAFPEQRVSTNLSGSTAQKSTRGVGHLEGHYPVNVRHARIMRSLTGAQLLILDDWGLDPLDAGARRDIYEILEERYGRRSTILTSQVPVDKWHEVIGDPTYADAILDRLVHNAHRIDLAGESLRRARPKSATKD